MKAKEATDILISLGWSAFKDEVGDRYTKYFLPDRVVQIIYGIEKIRENQKFGSTLTLTTVEFSRACSEIHDKPGDTPLISAWKGIDIRAPEILEQHIHQASNQAVEWARAQDLRKALHDHAALPTDAPGARPLLHLAALAILGDVERLNLYRSSFEAGNKLGFVNYITKEYIDRALEVAIRK